MRFELLTLASTNQKLARINETRRITKQQIWFWFNVQKGFKNVETDRK